MAEFPAYSHATLTIQQEIKMANTQAAPDVEVTKDRPLYITDSYRNFNNVTIKPGGQVFVQTEAPVSIEHLIKE